MAHREAQATQRLPVTWLADFAVQRSLVPSAKGEAPGDDCAEPLAEKTLAEISVVGTYMQAWCGTSAMALLLPAAVEEAHSAAVK